MIIDEVKINVEAGRGGDGHVSFRREKYVPKGGPDGGDGGKGGNIIFRANSSVDTLSNFAMKKNFKAEDGKPGSTSLKSGHSGEDLVLEVPPGTMIINEETGQKIVDIIDKSAEIIIAKGGRGGWGNVHFKSATNQAPLEFNPGEPGQKFDLKLELKLIADVGLIGFPNAGKSTLLSHISQARPKIADYPFTTLEPQLGVVDYHDRHFVIADIPGLIEGASGGKGLGHKFLKHIERTKILAHMIDINEPDITHSYKTIRQELKKYSKILSIKPEIIVINKIDTISQDELSTKLKEISNQLPKETIIPISGVTGQGIDEFLKTISKELSRHNKSEESQNTKNPD